MKEIKLPKDKIALIDDEDFEYLSQFKWYAHAHRRTFYARANVCISKGKRKSIKMHRIVMGLSDPRIKLDHVDHNGLNNQKCNLRTCTTQENSMNKLSALDSSSIYKGVTWHKFQKKWSARITKDGKCEHLGYFQDEADAAAAYNSRAVALFGEFVNLNKI